jgi:D-aspartate ligase
MLAQERIPATADDYVTVGLAVGPDGQVLGSYVGQRLEIAPAGFGTTCLARGVEQPDLEAQAIAVVGRLGYWGIAEVEFVRDPRDGIFKLLDLNTRPWKWIGLPIAAGVDLPGLLYAAALARPTAVPERRSNHLWISLKDYLPLRARGEAMQPGDPVGRARWLELIAGTPEATIVDAILDRADPEPAYRALHGVFGLSQYSCPC